MKKFLEQQLWLADWYFFIAVLNKKKPLHTDPGARITEGRGRDDAIDAGDVGDYDDVDGCDGEDDGSDDGLP